MIYSRHNDPDRLRNCVWNRHLPDVKTKPTDSLSSWKVASWLGALGGINSRCRGAEGLWLYKGLRWHWGWDLDGWEATEQPCLETVFIRLDMFLLICCQSKYLPDDGSVDWANCRSVLSFVCYLQFQFESVKLAFLGWGSWIVLLSLCRDREDHLVN